MLTGLLLLALARAGNAGAADEAALQRAKLEEWPGYYRRQDAEGLAGFLLADFQEIGSSGAKSGRDEALAWVRGNSWAPSNFRYEIDAIRFVTADVALVIGRGGSDRKGADGKPCRHSYVSSNLFRKLDGRWRPALSHMSGEKCA